jgi:hypothetical protein
VHGGDSALTAALEAPFTYPSNSSQNSTGWLSRRGNVQSRSWMHVLQRPLGGGGRSTFVPASLSSKWFPPELLEARCGPDRSGRPGLEECELCMLHLLIPPRASMTALGSFRIAVGDVENAVASFDKPAIPGRNRGS